MFKRFSRLVFSAAISVSASAVFAQQNLSGETANPGGTAYLSLSHLSEAAASAGIANIQLSAGQTLTNTTQNLAEGKTDIASTTFVLPFLMSQGRGPYSTLGAEKGAELAANLRLLYPYTLGVIGLYGYDSAGVQGWDDLKGRTLLNGPPRGGALTNARALIRIATGLNEGAGYTGVQVNWGQALKTITDGTVDAAVLPLQFPDTRVTGALAAGRMTLWSLPKPVYDSAHFVKLAKLPGSAPWIMDLKDVNAPEGLSVVSQDDKFRGLAIKGGDIVHKDMDFDLAKALVTAHIKTLDALKAKTPFAANVGYGDLDPVRSGLCGANPLKYHAGALAAWQEAGYEIDDCAKP
ncbi:TAXI family TRAP transporter solute-binding subunit [Roseobacter sp. N2S]|uniref:TAXI family TRAP transporter solute-binding subunit n=1 Tax=Roseobacter sp. N2S TaxID=2663844 RepID=UPI00285D604D|nr:TAXI family TRAP transporter solute-binding subunit [Roseobacter sp. N2S]MDR6264050.1 hypothetical protein [Roseobacter sp. N2S]